MLKLFVYFLILTTSFVAVAGQTPETKIDSAENVAKPSDATQRQRSIPFPAGVSLRYIVKELAKDLDLNVIFDADSRLENRTVRIDLQNVTSSEAIEYILLQEGLISEKVGPRTILVASQIRALTAPLIGAGLTPLGDQLAYFFGVDKGVLINHVYDNSPAAKAGLVAGDVIVEIDGAPVFGAVGLREAITKKNGSEFVLKVVRERKHLAISVTPHKG